MGTRSVPAQEAAQLPGSLGWRAAATRFLACPAPLGIRTSIELSRSHLFSAGSPVTLNQPEPPLAPRSCLANLQYSVSAVGREQGFPVLMHLLERSLCWVLHGCPYSCNPMSLRGGRIPTCLKCPLHFFVQSLFLISKTSSPALIF